MKKFIILLGVIAILCSSCAQKRTITVSGTGTISVQADIAIINLAVITTNPSVEVATKNNAEIVNKVRTDLVSAGYNSDSIVTDRYNINQEINYQNGVRIRGDYRVSNSMHIVVRDIANIGSVIDTAVKAGANEFSSIDFSVSEMEKAMEDAKAMAVEKAYKSADLMAKTAGAHLGKIIKIDEQNRNNNFPITNNFAKFEADAATGRTVVSPGKQKINVTVVCTYEIK